MSAPILRTGYMDLNVAYQKEYKSDVDSMELGKVPTIIIKANDRLEWTKQQSPTTVLLLRLGNLE